MLAAVIQMKSGEDLARNLNETETLVRRAADSGASLVGLPENFAYLGAQAQKVGLAEEISEQGRGPILGLLSGLARELGVYIAAGGIPERCPDPARTYNTLALLGPDGALLARYRKIHLFDIDLPVVGGRGIRESDTVMPGGEPVTADIPWGRLGLSICYDLRFPELYRRLTADGALALLVPSAFTLETGKDHWGVLLRARAIENQCYVLAPAQGGRHSAMRASWGHAMIVDPWGVIVAETGDRSGVAVADLDADYLAQVRAGLPALSHRRL